MQWTKEKNKIMILGPKSYIKYGEMPKPPAVEEKSRD